jgi:diguanylate cyclase (GGDEF)-like protein
MESVSTEEMPQCRTGEFAAFDGAARCDSAAPPAYLVKTCQFVTIFAARAQCTPQTVLRPAKRLPRISPMLLHPETLLIAASACVAISSAAAATIGVRQRLRRGVWWWIAANIGLAAALVLHSLSDQNPMFTALAALLALQWPIVTLTGMRRFFSRGGAAIPPWVDWTGLALAGLLAAGSTAAPFASISPAQILALAMLTMTLYVSLAVARLEDFETTPVLKSLLICLLCSAMLQAGWLGLAFFALAPSLGGDDFALGALLATAAAALLVPQISLVMNHERNVAQLRAAHRKLRHMVEVDPLTKLPNRRHFHELAAKAVAPAPDLATMLVFDVDRLKNINEVLGHAVGDEALRQIGMALRETLRRRDVAGRMDGDEFAIVLPRTKVGDVAAVIARINTRIDDRQVAPRIARVCLNAGATQMLANETIADALRRAEIVLETARDKERDAEALAGRMADSMPAEQAIPALEALAARRGPVSAAAPLNLIPIGEVLAGSASS